MVILIAGLFAFTACGSEKNANEEKVYDTDFVETLADALHNRWIEANKGNDDSQAESLEKATQIEIDKFQEKDFANKKFDDNKLKELALSYINELDAGLKVAKESSTNSLQKNWNEHFSKRTRLLVEINEEKRIPLTDEDQSTFKQLLNSGNEFKEQEAFDTKLEALLPTIQFNQKVQEFESSFKEYEAIVENTTGISMKSFSANVYLEDDLGTRIDTQYINAQDWAAGQKVTFTFMTDKEFSKVTVSKNFVELAE